MRTVEEITTELAIKQADLQRITSALDQAKARYRASLTPKSDLSLLDVEALAIGISIDREGAWRSVFELERRLQEIQKQINELRAELYAAATQPAIDEYNGRMLDLRDEFADLANRITGLSDILPADLRNNDPRLVNADALVTRLNATVVYMDRLRNPPPPRARMRLWRLQDGSLEQITNEEYEARMEQEREARRKRNRPQPPGVFRFFDPAGQ